MKKYVCLLLLNLLLNGCQFLPTYHDEQPDPPFVGTLTEVSGADIYYQPYVETSLYDWQAGNRTFIIEKKPAYYSKIGKAAIFNSQKDGKVTFTGEITNSAEFTAIHDTLPLPAYARITNIENGRQLIVRINDRGPLAEDKIIGISEAAAFRLNMNENSRIKVDAIVISPDGSLSGKGMYGSKIAELSFALPQQPLL